jgi:chromosome segregation ATPase
LKKELDELKSQIAKRDSESGDASSQLDASRIEIEKLKKQLESKETESGDTSSQLDASRIEIEKLKKQLESKETESGDTSSQLDASRIEIEKLKKQLESKETESGDTSSQLDASRIEIEKLKKQLESKETESGDTSSQLDASRIEIEKLKKQLESKETESGDTSSQLDASRKQFDELKTQLATLQKEKEKIESVENTKLDQEVQLKAIKDQLEEELKRVISLESEKQELKIRLQDKQIELDSLQNKFTEEKNNFVNQKVELEILISDKESQLTDLNSQFSKQREERESHAGDKEKAALDASERDAKTAALESELLACRSSLAETRAALADAETKLATAGEAVLAAERGSEQLRAELEKETENLRASDGKSKLLVAQVQEANENLRLVKDERDEAKMKLDEVEKLLKETNQKLKELIERKDLEITNLKNEVESRNRTIEDHFKKESSFNDLNSEGIKHVITESLIADPPQEEIFESTIGFSEKKSQIEILLAEIQKTIEEKNKEMKGIPKGKNHATKRGNLQQEIEALKTEKEGLTRELAKLDEDALAEATRAAEEKPPQVLVLPTEDQSTVQPQFEGQPPTDVAVAQNTEAGLAAQAHDQESVVGRWRLHLEKVFDHIALLDLEIKEHNHDLEEIAAQVANAERFKDCQQSIVDVLKKTAAGIRQLGKNAGIDAEQEVEKIEHVEAKIEDAIKAEGTSKTNSARSILLDECKPKVKVTTSTDETPESSINMPKIIEDEQKRLTEIKSQLENSTGEAVKVHYELVRAKLLEEKISDHIALLANSIKEYSGRLLIESDKINGDQEIVKHLNEARTALSKLLKVENENVRGSAKNILKDFPDTEANEDKSLKHAESPGDSPQRGKIQEDPSMQLQLIPKKVDVTETQEFEELKEKKSNTEKELSQANNSFNDQNLQAKKLEFDISELSNKINELNKQIDELKSSLKARQIVFENKKSEFDNLRSHLQTLKIESESLIVKETELLLQTKDHNLENTETKTGESQTAHDGGSQVNQEDSSEFKESDSRNTLRKSEHPSVHITPSMAPAPGEEIPIDPTAVYALIEKVKKAIDCQHQESTLVHKQRADIDHLLLAHEKILSNIAIHQASIAEKTEQLADLDKQLKADKENLGLRDQLAKLLQEAVAVASQLHGNAATAAVCQSGLKHLASLEQTPGHATHNARDVADREATEKVANAVRYLARVCQRSAMGQIKSICCLADLPQVVRDEDRQKYALISQSIEEHFEEEENEWQRINSDLGSQDNLLSYIQKIIGFEEQHLDDLDTLLDSIYENMTTRRSAHQSPQGKKF